jgi:PhnB protein
MQFIPYLGFNGNAREALEFYAKTLGARPDMTAYGDTPAAQHVPVSAHDRIMHGVLMLNGSAILMGSDAPSGTPSQPMSGVQVSLSGDAGTDAELSGYYDRLAQGGTVVEPLEQAPWGDKFGMVTDPYGVLWMVNAAGGA